MSIPRSDILIEEWMFWFISYFMSTSDYSTLSGTMINVSVKGQMFWSGNQICFGLEHNSKGGDSRYKWSFIFYHCET